MRLTIDNLDGLGAVDYSDALCGEGPLTMERVLNAPQTCRWMMEDATTRPARLGRVVVTMNDGGVLFTGYLPNEPEAVWTGQGTNGPVYRLQLSAISDDWLLDKQGLRVDGQSFAEGGDALLRSLTNRVDGSRFTTAVTGSVLPVGSLRTSAARSWSANAGAIANASGASYRVVAGEVLMAPLGSTVHTLATADDSLIEGGLRLGTQREVVNDITLTGPMEAGAYVTEIFVGDGTTTDFALSSEPYAGGSLVSRTLVADTFSAGVIDRQRWTGSDPGSHLGVGAGGLTLSGGNGLDGQTTLMAVDGMELGGGLLLEAKEVLLGQGSDGVLLGIYSGVVSRANCVAGVDVRQANGVTTLGALVNGAPAGTTMVLATGHLYSVRLHLHASETQRVRQSFVVMVGGVLQQFGGGLVDAPLDLVLELQDLGVSSNTPATVLYDGTLVGSPASVLFAPINSVQLVGSVGSILAERTAAVWVRGTSSTGAAITRLPGTTGTGADYTLASGGALHFFPGRLPAAGEQVTVQYRLSQRAAARVKSAASLVAEAKGGLPGESAWQGSVLSPPARSAEDCAAAAAALLALATSRAEAIGGSYEADNLPDIWPGDTLLFVTATATYSVTARRVQVTNGGAAPELVRWRVEAANDWVDCRSIHVSNAVAQDAGDVSAGAGLSTTPTCGGLRVVSVTSTTLQVDAGALPLAGGGFEVRRSEGGFGPGQGGSLVLRSGVRGFTLPRSSAVERFYVRGYDGSTPPVYSRVSSVVITDVPVG